MNTEKQAIFKKFLTGEPGTGGPAPVIIFLFAAALAVYAVLVVNSPAFDPKYSIYLDVSSFYWIQALFKPELFARDPMTHFYMAHLGRFNPESLWVWITSLFMRVTPYTAGLKVLSVAACVWTAMMVRRLAERSPARPAAGTAAILFAAYFLSMDTFFGVPRVYGLLAFLGFIWALEEERFLLLPVFIALTFMLYPVITVGLAVAAALVPLFFRERFRERRRWIVYFGALAVGGILCLLVLSRSVALGDAARALKAGTGFEESKLYQMVSAPLSLRDPMDAFLNFFLNINEHGKLYAIFTALLSGICVFSFFRSPGRPAMLPRSAPVMLAGSSIAFLLLYFIHPVSASRQMIFIVPLTLVFLASEALFRLAGKNTRPVVLIAVCAVLFAALHPRYNEILSCRDYRSAYEYLKRLPADALVAGYPGSMLVETVPVFAERTAFLADNHTDQRILLLREGDKVRGEREALLEALYSRTTEKAAELFSRYGVDYLILEKRYYSELFFGKIKNSRFPNDKYLAGILEREGEPAGFYDHACAHAEISWKNGQSEGCILDLRAAGPAKTDGKKAAGELK